MCVTNECLLENNNSFQLSSAKAVVELDHDDMKQMKSGSSISNI